MKYISYHVFCHGSIGIGIKPYFRIGLALPRFGGQEVNA
jgi:hypothetical protein